MPVTHLIASPWSAGRWRKVRSKVKKLTGGTNFQATTILEIVVG